MGRESPARNAAFLRPFTYAGVSSFICRRRISTPSKPIAAASSITFSIGYLSGLKCQ